MLADDDRLAEDHTAEDVADGAVGRAVHLLQAELLHARLIGGDRGALHADAVALDRFGRFDGDAVVGGVAALDAEVVVLELHVEVGQDQLLFDERPDDAGHLVAVELDDRVLHGDLGHGVRRRCYRRGSIALLRHGHHHRRRGHHTVFNQPPPLEGIDVFSYQPAARGGIAARGRRLGRASAPLSWASSSAASRSSTGGARPTRTSRSCARTTATATASTRSSSTPPGTS